MFSKMICDSPGKKLASRLEISDIHFLQLIQRSALKLVEPHRFGALCVALIAIALACAPTTAPAARVRWGDSTIVVSTTNLAFGNVSVNTPTSQSVTLTSTGSSSVFLLAATASGSGFTVSGASFPMWLPPGQSATLAVQFDPSAAGTVSGALTLISSSSTGRSTVVSLSGTGVGAATAGTLSVNAATISFGNVSLNSTASQTLILTSTGAGAVTVSGASISGNEFSVSGASFPITLAPNQIVVLSVQFDPTATSAATGTLILSSNSSTGGSTTIGLTGTGVSSGGEEVNLAWNAPASSSDPVAGYDVYRATDGTSSYQQLNTSPVTQTAYTDTTTADGQTYDYYVESVDSSGNSSTPSNTVSVNVP
jgi:hypothetical protein